MEKHNKKVNLNTDKKVKKTMKIKPVKKKKLALKSVKHNTNEKVEQVVNSTDTEFHADKFIKGGHPGYNIIIFLGSVTSHDHSRAKFQR